MKTKKELEALKKEIEALNKKLVELTEEELKEVVGGTEVEFVIDDRCGEKELHFYDSTEKRDFKPAFPTDSDK